MDTGYSLVAVVLLLAANALFVAAEFALVKARGLRIDNLAAAGSAAAKLTLRIQHNLESYLAACQLGISMASLGLGWIGGATVAALLEPYLASIGWSEQTIHMLAFITAFLVFSSLHIVFGAQVPKALAMRRAEPVSLALAYPLHWIYLAVYPLNWALNRVSGVVLRALGLARVGPAKVLSREEIKGLVRSSRAHREPRRDKVNMPDNLFEFDQRQVGRVMIPLGHVDALDVAGDPGANLRVIRDSGHSRFPVIDSADEDAIRGIVLVKDIHAAMLDGEAEPWKDLARFLREPMIVPESQRVSELFDLMRLNRAHMAFVVDEYGQMAGVITLEDLLEEIVGEIQDETDDEEPQLGIQQVAENVWEANGLLSLSDLERCIAWQLPADLDANTLSGLFMQRLSRMPETGDRVREGDFVFIVLSLEERRVGKVHIERERLEPVMQNTLQDAHNASGD